MKELPDILLIDKPAGMSSFGVIRRLRKATGIRKFGHAGTLDPLATGLLILGVNGGTKKLADLIKLDKEYVAQIRIGERRTTGDLEGEVLESAHEVDLSREEVEAAVKSLVGTVTLPVSAYSAIKKDGTPWYKRAREAAKIGEVLHDVPVRNMRVLEADVQQIEGVVIDGNQFVIVTVRFSVGSGTYIRSLAEEVGRRVGYPSTLQSLRRTKVGKFDVKDAHTLDEF